MADDLSYQQLISQRRLYEANEVLLKLKQRNHRIYGLDEMMTKLQRALATANDLLIESRVLADQGQIRQAVIKLRTLEATVVDYPQVADDLRQLDAQLAKAQSLRESAGTFMQQRAWDKASSIAQEALKLDPESATARRQIVSSMQASKAIETKKLVRKGILLGGGLALLVAFAAVLTVVSISRQNQLARETQEKVLVDSKVGFQNALKLIKQEKYTDAASRLREAEDALTAHDLANNDLYMSIRLLHASSDFKNGLSGLVPLDHQWVSPAARVEALEKRITLKNSFDVLSTQINQWLSSQPKGWPIKTPRQVTLLGTLNTQITQGQAALASGDDQAASRLATSIAAALKRELQDTGLVHYKDQWMLAEQAHEQQMTDKGLVRYDDQWVTPDRKFFLEQTAKGLVLFEDHWYQAKTVQELQRQRALNAQRDRNEAQAKAARIEKERLAAAAKAESERKAKAQAAHEENMKRLTRAAYEMSQVAVKRILKAPATARFPAYADDDVMISETDTRGHFRVIAYVDSQNGFGALLRSRYVVEIWPDDPQGKIWRWKSPVLLDQ